MGLFLTVLFTHLFAIGKVHFMGPFVVTKIELRWSALVLLDTQRALKLSETAAEIKFVVVHWNVLFYHNSVTFGVSLGLDLGLKLLDLNYTFFVLLHQVTQVGHEIVLILEIQNVKRISRFNSICRKTRLNILFLVNCLLT